jgi:hypothetical protein
MRVGVTLAAGFAWLCPFYIWVPRPRRSVALCVNSCPPLLKGDSGGLVRGRMWGRAQPTLDSYRRQFRKYRFQNLTQTSLLAGRQMLVFRDNPLDKIE